MSTSLFERMSSFLLAVAWLLALGVGWLAVIWWLRGEPTAQVPPNLPPVHNAVQSAADLDRGFLPVPAAETVAMQSASVQDWVDLATRIAVQVALQTDVEGQDGVVNGDANGKGRMPGPEGHSDRDRRGEEGIPRSERWEIVIQAASLRDYAVQLDQLGIELGVVGRLPGVDYAQRLSREPLVRHGSSADEQRLYFSWTSPSPLIGWEQQLLADAGVDWENRLVLRFLSPELENELARLELQYATGRGYASVEQIAKTVFVATGNGGSSRFVVGSQRYQRTR